MQFLDMIVTYGFKFFSFLLCFPKTCLGNPKVYLSDHSIYLIMVKHLGSKIEQ